MMKKSYLIAGVDPGATVGIALLDLKGRLVALQSYTNGGLAEAVKTIENYGTPSIIACDVFPPSEFALKLSSYFSCKLYSPPKEIREEAKRRSISEMKIPVKNNHERDAYMAALNAYRQNANKLRQIDSLDGLKEEEKEKIKHLMMKGYRIKDAFLEISEPAISQTSDLEQELKKESENHINYAKVEELRRRISFLARENAHLKMLISRLEAEKKDLEHKIRLFEKGVRQSFLKDSEMRKLRFQLNLTLKKLKDKNTWKTKKNEEKEISKNTENESSKEKNLEEKNPIEKKDSKTPNNKKDNLNNLSSQIDLEKLVAEYRKNKEV